MDIISNCKVPSIPDASVAISKLDHSIKISIRPGTASFT